MALDSFRIKEVKKYSEKPRPLTVYEYRKAADKTRSLLDEIKALVDEPEEKISHGIDQDWIKEHEADEGIKFTVPSNPSESEPDFFSMGTTEPVNPMDLEGKELDDYIEKYLSQMKENRENFSSGFKL